MLCVACSILIHLLPPCTSQRVSPGHTEGVLQYISEEEPEPTTSDPVSTETQCTQLNPCYILNCPFQSLPPELHAKCLDVTQLRSTQKNPIIAPADENDIVEIFLNFHFSGINTVKMFRPNINGKVFTPPDKPLQVNICNLFIIFHGLLVTCGVALMI